MNTMAQSAAKATAMREDVWRAPPIRFGIPEASVSTNPLLWRPDLSGM